MNIQNYDFYVVFSISSFMIYMKCLFVNNLYCYFYSIFKKYEVLNVKFRVPKYFVLIINNLFKSFYKVIYIYI